MTETGGNDSADLPTFEWIPVSEFEPPSGTFTESTKGLWARMKEALFSTEAEAEKAADFDRLTDFSEPQFSVAELTENFPHEGSRVVVFAPWSPAENIVDALAVERSLTQSLGIPALSLPLQAKLEEGVSAVSDLGQFFLKHHEGLGPITLLIQELERNPNCLVACNSWAWAYLDKIFHLSDQLGPPLTLAAWDATDLQARILHECERTLHRKGEPLSYDETLPFFERLAASSRGNVGVARALWQASLRKSPTGDLELLAWDEVTFPSMPSDVGSQEAQILYLTLLHGCLSEQLLAQILLTESYEIRAARNRLKASGILDRDGRLVCSGYPAVRLFLVSEGLLDDGF